MKPCFKPALRFGLVIAISAGIAAPASASAVWSGYAASGNVGTPSTATVAPTQTSTTLTAGPQIPATNQTVTLTATVMADSGSATPTGTVDFLNNGTDIAGCSGELMTNSGTAMCETSLAASSSPESLTATYNPSSDSDFATSTSNPATPMTVEEATTTTTVSALATSPSVGQSVTYTATVSPQFPGPAEPSGSVGFSDNGSPISGCSSQPVGAFGTATCTTSYGAAGLHSITATYGGDGNFAGSGSSAQTVTVQPTPPPVTRLTNGNVSRASVKVTLSCTGTSGSSCTDTLKLWVIGRLKKLAVVRSRTVRLAAGQTEAVSVSLDRTGKRLLAQVHTLKVRLKITQSGTTVASRTVEFHEKKAG